jgi:uncharacterized damage-inducible protein DinB
MMAPMTEWDVLFEAWDRNARVNDALLEHLTPELMRLDDRAGGWTVAQHLAEMSGFRKDWLSEISPSHQTGLEFMHRALPGGGWEAATDDPAAFREAFRAADAAVAAAVRDAIAAGGFRGPVYARHPAFFVHHALVHDAHHRGQLLMTLRLAGRRWEEADGPMWAPWRE